MINILSSLHSLFGEASALVTVYGYPALFILMLLESAALPIPSEVVLPLAGLLAARGVFNVYLVFAIVLIAGVLGMAIDYYIAYFLGKDLVYKHLRRFHISKESLGSFDRWFERNGAFTVFIGRLLPEIRGLVSFPAGFAAMPKKKFFAYSIAGTAIWDVALISFGYYALNANNAYVVMVAVAVFAIVLYAIFRMATKRVRRS